MKADCVIDLLRHKKWIREKVLVCVSEKQMRESAVGTKDLDK